MEDWASGLSTLREQMRRASEVATSLTPSKQVVASADDQAVVAMSAANEATESAIPAEAAPILSSAAIAPARNATPSTTALLERARRLLKLGDVAAARLLMDRAATDGNAEAEFALAETFDPSRLAAWRVRGVRPDTDKARSLYEQALRHGFAEAATRLSSLK
ncbi:SEL1-like repeat protein [Methylobacterium planeticum]|uniref:Sel1 repeat family protein n=1 Tax=Methylobacterium planeticum TaxID=2615211 RepID=A0A6N6MKG1_9HYPH|nr:hypothetical protein [Methylobacterium planeticum]KAB1071668.1 hypothetical protein F6X51_19115 [Methylobacterium planeticum]